MRAARSRTASWSSLSIRYRARKFSRVSARGAFRFDYLVVLDADRRGLLWWPEPVVTDDGRGGGDILVLLGRAKFIAYEGLEVVEGGLLASKQRAGVFPLRQPPHGSPWVYRVVISSRRESSPVPANRRSE
jgi:hypothetical protein